MRKALVRQSDGYAANIIEIEDGVSWGVPAAHTLIDAGDGSIGDTWDGNTFIKPSSTIPEPPRSTHISTLESVTIEATRPARIKRVWNRNDYYYTCFVTQTVKNEYQAGNIQIGDYVLVHFDDIGEQVVTAKVYKSW